MAMITIHCLDIWKKGLNKTVSITYGITIGNRSPTNNEKLAEYVKYVFPVTGQLDSCGGRQGDTKGVDGIICNILIESTFKISESGKRVEANDSSLFVLMGQENEFKVVEEEEFTRQNNKNVK